MEALLGGKFMALNAYIRKEEKSQINHLSSYLKNIEKAERNKLKASRKKETVKIRPETHELKTEKQ